MFSYKRPDGSDSLDFILRYYATYTIHARLESLRRKVQTMAETSRVEMSKAYGCRTRSSHYLNCIPDRSVLSPATLAELEKLHNGHITGTDRVCLRNAKLELALAMVSKVQRWLEKKYETVAPKDVAIWNKYNQLAEQWATDCETNLVQVIDSLWTDWITFPEFRFVGSAWSQRTEEKQMLYCWRWRIKTSGCYADCLVDEDWFIPSREWRK